MSRVRIGIHPDLREHGAQDAVYREALDLFARAEALGFDSARVRSYHFRRTSGTPAQIAESIGAFPALPSTTQLQFSVAYGTTRARQRLDAVEAVAAEIAPAPGWVPARVSGVSGVRGASGEDH